MAALPGWTSLPTTLVGTPMDSQLKKSKTKEVGEEEKRKGSKGTGTFKIPVVRCDELVRAQPKKVLSVKPGDGCGSSADGTPVTGTESDYSTGADWGDLSHLLVSRYRDRSELRREAPPSATAQPKRRSAARRRATEEEDSDTGSDLSLMSAEDRLSRGESSRRRGRPPSTGDYVGLAAAKERLNEARRMELELEKEQRVFDPSVNTPAPSRSSRPLVEVEQLMREAKQLPVADLVAEMIRSTDTIRRVAAGSSNLKGTFVRSLRESSNVIEAYAAELGKRPTNAGPEDGEVQELRRRLQEAEADRARLRRDVDELRRLMERRDSDAGSGLPDLSRPTTPAQRMEEDTVVRKRRASTRNSSDEGEATKRRATVGQTHQPPPEETPTQPQCQENPAEQLGEVARLARAVASLTIMVRDLASEVRRKEPPPPPPTVARKVKGRDNAGTEKPEAAGRQPVASSRPHDQSKGPGTWAEVVGGKARKQATSKQASGVAKLPPPTSRTKTAPKPAKKRQPTLPKPPAMAAFTITVPNGVETTYTSVMMKAREAVPAAQLQEIGIKEFKVRKSVTGGLVLAVPGEEGGRKVDELVGRLKEAFKDSGVRITRPSKTADLRVVGIEDSVNEDEAREALARVGECDTQDIRVGQIKRTPRSMGTLWVRCPLAAANKIADAKRVRMGWASARVEVLASRPFFCYRCLQQGHTANQCGEATDRSHKCYRCGKDGHRAAQCSEATANCPLCSDLGRPAAHRLGASGCAPRPKRRSRKAAAPIPPEVPNSRVVQEDDTMTE